MSGRDAASDPVGRAKVAAVGDSVKVERNRERFWVKVTRVCEGTIHGWVDNDLRQNPELQYGDSIALQPADVLEVARPVDFALVRQRAEQLQALWSYGCHPFISHHKAVRLTLGVGQISTAASSRATKHSMRGRSTPTKAIPRIF